MPQIGYVDLHCDTLTSPKGQVTVEKLREAGCALQCFAYFADGGVDFGGALEEFYKIAANAHCERVRRFSDFERARAYGKIGCALTCENLDWCGDIPQISRLFADGVIMASLVWNEKNALACPAYDGLSMRRGGGGLSERGREIVAELDEYKIIVDISHLSDEASLEILRGRKIPLVASHSLADGTFAHPRNLTDGIIKKIADCGGVIGLNFCPKFLGGGETVARVCAHARHIINIAGEDVLAIGSDFDGITPPEDFPDCGHIPRLLRAFEVEFGRRVTQKIACGNFSRVFSQIRP